MPRKAREKSNSDIYHIIMRGINRQTIFEDDEDSQHFIQTIRRYKEQSGYKIYAYCLMGNHVHLLLKIGIEPLEQVMRRIGGSYVYWYNSKYQRVGNLFQDRFKSEAVETDSYFLIVQRYIHQNPVKAGIVTSAGEYPWSSFSEYTDKPKIVDVDFLLGIFSNNSEQALRNFIQYTNEANDNVCLDIDSEVKQRITDEEARNIIKTVCQVNNTMDLQKLDIKTRNSYLRDLKQGYNLSIRQIERLTGISRGIVFRA